MSFVSVDDRIKQVGEIEGVDGIKLHLPLEINDDNANVIEREILESTPAPIKLQS